MPKDPVSSVKVPATTVSIPRIDDSLNCITYDVCSNTRCLVDECGELFVLVREFTSSLHAPSYKFVILSCGHMLADNRDGSFNGIIESQSNGV